MIALGVVLWLRRWLRTRKSVQEIALRQERIDASRIIH